MEEIKTVCRVCLQNGASWSLFHKRNMLESKATPGVALDRLIEKFRYVTLLKIDDEENLPRFICDLCIVQLNVSYQFKRQAVEADVKFRQFMIEKGLSLSNNDFTALTQQGHIRHSSTASSTVVSRDSPQTFIEFPTRALNQTSFKPAQRPSARLFRPMPIQIKIEPNTEECEIVSNLTVSPVQSDRTSDVLVTGAPPSDQSMPPVLELEEPLVDSSTSHFDTSGSDLNHNQNLEDQVSMVHVNGDKNVVAPSRIINSIPLDSDKDIEFISRHVSSETVLLMNGNTSKESAVGGIIVAGRKRNKNETVISVDEYQEKPSELAKKIKEEMRDSESVKRYPARTSTDQTKKADSTKPGRKAFNEMDIEIFSDRLRRLNRETQAIVGGKARTNQLRTRLNQLKEINRKQGHKTTKGSGSNVLKLISKKKKDALTSVINGTDAMRTRKYKNPFSKTNDATATANGVAKKKNGPVKDDKRPKVGQKVKTQSKAGMFNVAALIGKRGKSKQKDQEKVNNSKAEK